MSSINKKYISKELVNGIKMLGDQWTLFIVGSLAKREMRFNQIQRMIPNLCPATLTNRLKELERDKIVKRKEETIDKLSVVYSLTNKGRGILPILSGIQTFADKFL